MNEQDKERLKREIREKLEERLDSMVEEAAKFTDNPCAPTLLSMEKKVNAILDQLGDEVAGSLVKCSADSQELQTKAVDDCKKNSASTTGTGQPPSNSPTA